MFFKRYRGSEGLSHPLQERTRGGTWAQPQCLVAHDCGYPLSRYTCRATRVAADFLDFIAFCRCSTGVALHPLKILVSHLPPPLCREVSHRNLGLKRCRATRGCRSYSCGCRATLCKVPEKGPEHWCRARLSQCRKCL